MFETPMLKTDNNSTLAVALSKLRSLHDGDVGVVETIARGEIAIPHLREILFSREPSGIYETRRRAVEALSGLHAFEVLREFLSKPREITDPVERTGEDAVINAAARALGHTADSRNLPLLLFLIRERPLAGVIEALGQFRRIGTLPYFIEALGDDFLRRSAEQAIRPFGKRARRHLIQAALERSPMSGREAADSIGRRRSALHLLEELPLTSDMLPPAFFDLVNDIDAWIALRSARICLPYMTKETATRTLLQLIMHLKKPDEVLAVEIEDVLVEHFSLVEGCFAAAEKEAFSTIPVWRSTDHTWETLARVKRRGRSPHTNREDQVS